MPTARIALIESHPRCLTYCRESMLAPLQQTSHGHNWKCQQDSWSVPSPIPPLVSVIVVQAEWHFPWVTRCASVFEMTLTVLSHSSTKTLKLAETSV